MLTQREGRTTPADITKLEKDEIIVFESNEPGVHVSGMAKIAKEKFGARDGQGYGPIGQSFAIPMKGWDIDDELPEPAMECYVGRFAGYAILHPDKKFLVTEIGSKLTHHKPETIASLFGGFVDLKNVYLPASFWDAIEKEALGCYVDTMLIENDGRKNEI